MIDTHEVTNADFANFVEATASAICHEKEESPQSWRAAHIEGRDNHPVVFVTDLSNKARAKSAVRKGGTHARFYLVRKGIQKGVIDRPRYLDSLPRSGLHRVMSGAIVG